MIRQYYGDIFLETNNCSGLFRKILIDPDNYLAKQISHGHYIRGGIHDVHDVRDVVAYYHSTGSIARSRGTAMYSRGDEFAC